MSETKGHAQQPQPGVGQREASGFVRVRVWMFQSVYNFKVMTLKYYSSVGMFLYTVFSLLIRWCDSYVAVWHSVVKGSGC